MTSRPTLSSGGREDDVMTFTEQWGREDDVMTFTEQWGEGRMTS